MVKTDIKSLADIEFQLHWKSHYGTHTDCFFAERVSLWRDFLPKGLSENLLNRHIGDTVDASFDAGEIILNHDPSKSFHIKHSQFENNFIPDIITYPRQGRFYPKGILKDIANVFRINMVPFRCAEINHSNILVDFNHPLAGTKLHIKSTIIGIGNKKADMGGMCNNWIDILTTWPGMQIRWNGQPTDFFSDNPFARTDETPDRTFYERPRLVNHIDDTAIVNISGLYGNVLNTGDNVLDLMSSWKSHIPPHLKLGKVTGLGLNLEELNKNDQLTDIVIHDLNENPVLPFEDKSFDAVICTVSVEYLTNPLAVFKEVGRILNHGGCFIVTFSNRWFPPKAITIWQQIQEFERMGLVSEYFLLSEQFGELNTHSIRGLPRPNGDKYYGELLVSDPVYGVWAYRR